MIQAINVATAEEEKSLFDALRALAEVPFSVSNDGRHWERTLRGVLDDAKVLDFVETISRYDVYRPGVERSFERGRCD